MGPRKFIKINQRVISGNILPSKLGIEMTIPLTR